MQGKHHEALQELNSKIILPGTRCITVINSEAFYVE